MNLRDWSISALAFAVAIRDFFTSGTVKFLLRARKTLGKEPIVWDVGANVGMWTRVAQLVLGKGSTFMAFEANIVHLEDLRRLKRTSVMIGLLGATEGEDLDFFSTGGTGDSVYRENGAVHMNLEPTRMKSRTLAGILEDGNLHPPDLLKIDTQGSELDILKGLGDHLLKVPLVLLEMPLVEYNLGSPQFSDTLNFLASKDFVPLELLEVHRMHGVLVQIDLAFANRNLPQAFG